jgi:hypothetical protein
MAGTTYVAVKLASADGVVKLHVASVVSTYPTSDSIPADAAATTRATVMALEDLLGDASVALIPPGTIGIEAQLIN